MKRLIYQATFALIGILFSPDSSAQKPQSIENIMAFSRLYGYVRYFYPGDEAAAIDWNKFVIYGIQLAIKSQNNSDLLRDLKDIFLPIVPTLQLVRENDSVNFDKGPITPEFRKGYKTIAWQHVGVGLHYNNIYQSERTNRPFSDIHDSIIRKSHKYLFKAYPKVGEYIQKNIGRGLKAVFPLALYGDLNKTYPAADANMIKVLKE
ncbi:MAG TPA: hypothetical protein VK616_12790, partial [Flavitalea sp.]|nr:hypothetical protein [Flavitalea sp.]